MRKPLSLALSTLWIVISSVTFSGQDRSRNESIRDGFVGAWRLAGLEEAGTDGKVHRADCTGLLVYTHDGHMSVQVMYMNRPTGGQSGPVQYAQGGYEASFGRYEINDDHTFTFHVEGSLVKALIGRDLKRVYELSGKQLIVKSPDPNEHWRVAWEQY